MSLQQFGPLRAEVTYGEGGKFTAPLVLVHGLWSTAAVWRPFAGYLSHRGWSCFAVELHGAGAGEVVDVEPLVADLRAMIAVLDAPPVIVGHDLGGVIAQHCADVSRALVALAPLVLPPLATDATQALREAGGVFARFLGRPLRPPRGRWKGAYETGDVGESAALLRLLVERPPAPRSLPAEFPGLVVAGREDPVTPPASAQALSASMGAELEVVTGGHRLLVEAGWEERVARVHRWLIKKLGAELLALYEEAIADREGDR
jgi:pimeloyl-ACP methyl ester carboxylesterase